ncbi:MULTISPECIES: hypothetical protein [unclassified Moraxella]|uniref:hypothetical protein n=1 Tax=unclassified Moraxella TaxID=2685852 RepID=UPI003AF775DB
MSEFFTSPAMQTFLVNISHYPTVIFTALVLFVTLYWLVSVFGLVDVDTDFHADMSGDTNGFHHAPHADLHADANTHHAHHTHAHHHDGDMGLIASILLKFGLQGVPIFIILTLFGLVGWVLSYLNGVLLEAILPPSLASGIGYFVIATFTLLAISIVSLAISGLIVAPIRKRFASSPVTSHHTLVGQVAVVRTMTVDDTHGEAVINDGGAGLILKVRAFDKNFVQGDTVVLVEYLGDSNAYRVKGLN